MTEQNVVIADRDRQQAKDIASVVGELGFGVYLAENLEGIIDIFGKKDVGILILDTSILEAVGFEKIDSVRRLKRDVPIIVTTPTPSEAMEKAIRSHGIAYYAPKPVDFYWIKEIVRRSFRYDYPCRSGR